MNTETRPTVELVSTDPRVLYAVNFANGMRTEVVANTYGFGVKLIDRDADQVVPYMTTFSSREQAIAHANELAGLKAVSRPTELSL